MVQFVGRNFPDYARQRDNNMNGVKKFLLAQQAERVGEVVILHDEKSVEIYSPPFPPIF